jgi:hypothetical protein
MDKAEPVNREMCSSSKECWRASGKSTKMRKKKSNEKQLHEVGTEQSIEDLNNSWDELHEEKADHIHQQRLHHAPRGRDGDASKCSEVSEARKQWKTIHHRYRVHYVGTSDFDAQMSGKKILKGDEIL